MNCDHLGIGVTRVTVLRIIPVVAIILVLKDIQVSAATSTDGNGHRSEEHTSELQSLMRISYAVFCLKKKKQNQQHKNVKELRHTTMTERVKPPTVKDARHETDTH